MPPGFSGADFFYLLPELVLTGGALLVLLLEIFLPRGWKGALPWVTLGVLAATGFALLPGAGQNLTIAKGLLAVDGFGFFFKVLFLLSACITVLMSVRYLEIERASAGEYYFLILCATLGMMFMAAGIDLITLFIGLETMAVSFYILVGYLRPSRRSNEAAVKYFVLGTFSLAILL
ncbi:MAG: NADH-quinone oxidoreductase subunit N, partial [Acidobacteria bacterium]|nr:NADH-quinone oxidoreductase subunit N [Acidobacteriota bacterium]